MKVIHNIMLVRDNGDIEYHDVEGEWNEEGSGGPSFKPLYKLLDCKLIEIAYGMGDMTKELPMFLDEEGLYSKAGPIINYKASQLQRDWCKQEGRVQMSPLVGDVAIDLGLTVESTEQVSKFIEDQNERQDNTAQA